MPFNVEQFKSGGLKLGGARPSLFEITISQWPGSGSAAPPRLTFLAKASSIPPSVVESIDIPYFGRKVKVLGDRVFPNWSITVMNDEDFLVRNAFVNWHEQMNGKVTNVMADQVSPNINSYKRIITVTQYSKGGEIPPGGVPFQCDLYGAFPVTVDAIQLDWDAINQVEQFDVEFAYDYWIAGQARDSGNQITDTLPVPA